MGDEADRLRDQWADRDYDDEYEGYGSEKAFIYDEAEALPWKTVVILAKHIREHNTYTPGEYTDAIDHVLWRAVGNGHVSHKAKKVLWCMLVEYAELWGGE